MRTRISPRLALVLGLAIAAAWCGRGLAQEVAPAAPDVSPSLRAIGDAFARVADRSASGRWADADAAFNDALGALDEHRPPVEGALGPVATTVFDQIDALVPDLVAAMDAEDPERVRAVVGLVRAQLATLGDGGDDGAPPESAAIEIVLEWRASAEEVLALGVVGSWRDMRNAALDLTADVARRGQSVAAAGAPAVSADVDVARVLAMRMRAAALDQSLTDARAVAAVFDAATSRLLTAVGAGAPPTADAAATGVRMRFRAYRVEASVGDVVVMPIVADDIPQIGLGAFDLVARWSPQALRLVDVTWDVPAGTQQRDDIAGTVRLTLPQAPTGPAGNAILARLDLEVRGTTFDPRAYLPRDEVERLESSVSDARAFVRQGDVPKAARILAAAYIDLVGGRDEPGRLYAELDRAGLADALAATVLGLVDATSQPIETDAILVMLLEAQSRLTATWTSYLVEVGGGDAVPVVLVVRSASDSAGAPLPWLEPIAGQVVLPGAAARAAMPATPVAGAAVGPGGPSLTAGLPATARQVVGASDATTTPVVAAASGDAATRRVAVPLPMLAALVLAGLLGAGAMLMGDRGDGDPSDPPPR